jgi:hypothetical protein
LTITSILRIESFVRFLNTTNPTEQYASLHYWSLIECNISVICACLPDARVFFLRNIPVAFGCATARNPSVSEGKEWSPYPTTISKGNTNTISVKRTVSVDYESPRSRSSYRSPMESLKSPMEEKNFLKSATNNVSPLHTMDLEFLTEEPTAAPTTSPGTEHAINQPSHDYTDLEFSHVWPLPNEAPTSLRDHDDMMSDSSNLDVIYESVARRVDILPPRPTSNKPTHSVSTDSAVRSSQARVPPLQDAEDRPPQRLNDGFRKWEIIRR